MAHNTHNTRPGTLPADSGTFASAVDAASRVFDDQLGSAAPARPVVEAALSAAGDVYDQATDAAVDRVMRQTGFAGMDIRDGSVQLRLKHAADIAAAMVSAFDALIEVHDAENYVEWESTVTDPAREQAMQAGLPPEQWPPHRRYRLIVVKPGGKTPHELRREAEARLDALVGHRDALRHHMATLADQQPWDNRAMFERLLAALETATKGQ